MYTETDLQELDSKWREIIFSLPIVDNIHEFLLLKFVLTYQKQIEGISAYPYIFAYEFPLDPELTGEGKIDLILANINDGKIQFKVVEFKYLQMSTGPTSSTSRRRKRRKVEEQSFLNAQRFKRLYKEAEVTGTYFTNESSFMLRDLTYLEYIESESQKIQEVYPFLEFSPI